jgi:hypothetical protein
VDDDLCPRCGIESETPEHLFLHCDRLAEERREVLNVSGGGSDQERMRRILTLGEGLSCAERINILRTIEDFLVVVGVIPRNV